MKLNLITILTIVSLALPIRHTVYGNPTGVNQSDPMAVQTMLISRFVSFMNSWEGDHLNSNSTAPFYIAVIGSKTNTRVKAVKQHLDEVYKKQGIKIDNRTVKVLLFDDIEELKKSGINPSIIYIKDVRKSTDLNSILNYSYVNNVFLISDGRDLSSRGIHVAFYISGSKVTFSVNKCTTERSGIKFNYQVYQMANRVINNCDG